MRYRSPRRLSHRDRPRRGILPRTAVLPLLGAALVLGACTRLPVADDGRGYDERRELLESLSGWEMRGRLAVDTGERAFQGRFAWRQDRDQLALSVRGPFGAGSFEIAGSPEAMTLRARGESWTLVDPETELSDLVGWWVPVGSLGAWLVGVPDRLFDARPQFDPDGQLVALEQRLWRLDYGAYQLSEGVLVPRSIQLSHDALRLSLTVDAWNPIGAAATP